MKTTPEISKLSKEGKSRYFRPRDIKRLDDLCSKDGIEIQFDSPFVFVEEGWYEMYWLPHRFVVESRTGKPVEDLTKANKLIIEGILETDWIEEIKGLPGLFKKVKIDELKESQILNSIWIKVSLVL